MNTIKSKIELSAKKANSWKLLIMSQRVPSWKPLTFAINSTILVFVVVLDTSQDWHQPLKKKFFFTQILKISYCNWNSNNVRLWRMFYTWFLQSWSNKNIWQGRYMNWNIYKQLNQAHPGFAIDTFRRNTLN